jgi:hypothetical protein
VCEWKVAGTGWGSFRKTSFGFSGVKHSGSATTARLVYILSKHQFPTLSTLGSNKSTSKITIKLLFNSGSVFINCGLFNDAVSSSGQAI